MLISYGLRKARCRCSKGQNKTAHNRVPPNGPVGLFQKKGEQAQSQFSMVVPRGGLAQSKQINDLSVRGTPESPYTIIRLSAASVQRQDGADPSILNGISPPFRLGKSSIPPS